MLYLIVSLLSFSKSKPFYAEAGKYNFSRCMVTIYITFPLKFLHYFMVLITSSWLSISYQQVFLVFDTILRDVLIYSWRADLPFIMISVHLYHCFFIQVLLNEKAEALREEVEELISVPEGSVTMETVNTQNSDILPPTPQKDFSQGSVT